jgi:alkanesulfonate monooxygenase SsuD/methylene tetrahydromethanopterin reductase-like flavin-dependent oxidoreductase (luciferase family)
VKIVLIGNPLPVVSTHCGWPKVAMIDLLSGGRLVQGLSAAPDATLQQRQPRLESRVIRQAHDLIKGVDGSGPFRFEGKRFSRFVNPWVLPLRDRILRSGCPA